ncbi:Cell division cycle protein [Gracilaria domingensis]|nr:Cell division cycle protein [Gracilaria domingensis]
MPGTADPTSASFAPNAWVPRFRRRTPKTRFVWLTPSVLSSLLEGTVKTATQEGVVEWSDGTTSDVSAETSIHIDLEAAINASINELGGAVCPKFGSKCPSDATWVNFHRSMKCTSADDVLVMFSSSERVMRTVTPENGCYLALRKWADVDDRMEFRVFVRDEEVVAISQRSENFFEYSDEEMDSIVDKITGFYEAEVKGSFPGSFVVDIYIERENVWIIDFDHWEVADALLYSWEELTEAHRMSNGRPLFRCALRCGVVPSNRLYDGLPLELRREDAIRDFIATARRLIGEQAEDETEHSSGNEDD